jgi:hypothetical protein
MQIRDRRQGDRNHVRKMPPHRTRGAAMGAFHQTGWTGVIADLIRRRHGEVEAVGDVVRRLGTETMR